MRALALLAGTACGLWAQTGFYLRDGDRVVFYGDSITDQRLYTTFTETFAVTRFPSQHFTFIHSGWGGDRVSGGGGGPVDLRLQRDVLAYKPTVMTIMLGMNDAGYRAFDQGLFTTYADGYKHILDTVQSALPGIRITVIEPSPFDDVTQPVKFEGGYNAVLLRYAQFVKELGTSKQMQVADLNGPVVAALRKAKEADAAGAQKLIPDRVHPGPAGHLLMAEALLKAWNAPAVVSDVELDVGTRHVDKSANADVKDWNGTSWTETDQALPMPIDWKDSSTVLAINSSDFLEALDQETLRVSGLHAGKWQLNIDGHGVGTFSNEDLGAGINLARYDTPMMEQAMTVHDYTKKHAAIHNAKWREVQVPLAKDDVASKDAVFSAMDKLDAELAMKQHQAAQPVTHQFELVPQK